MKKRNLLLAALLLILVAPSFAAKVDPLFVNSPSMNKDCLLYTSTFTDAQFKRKTRFNEQNELTVLGLGDISYYGCSDSYG